MTKHKHYQCIRAYADGWEIEYEASVNTWRKSIVPVFNTEGNYRIVPDSEGWLPWYYQNELDIPFDEELHEYKSTTVNGFLYRPKPAPKTKTIKMLAYLSPSGCMYWCAESARISNDRFRFTRVPSEDKTIEVEDA